MMLHYVHTNYVRSRHLTDLLFILYFSLMIFLFGTLHSNYVKVIL